MKYDSQQAAEFDAELYSSQYRLKVHTRMNQREITITVNAITKFSHINRVADISVSYPMLPTETQQNILSFAIRTESVQ